MKQLKTILSVIAFAFGLTLFMYCNDSQDNNGEILQSTTDERGLTSVIFTQGADTFALDYLTPLELDSLKHTLK